MDKVIAWMVDHPEFMIVVGWPVITGVFNFVFKWRSEEEFQKMNPYLRGVLRVTTSLGVDPVKATKIVKQLTIGGEK